jgi:hypothetical protein
MKARTQNTVRAMVAAMMMTMGAASMASAVQPQGLPRDNRVPTRTMAEYGSGSWLAPAAVVLDSKQAWDEWNQAQVASGYAVNVEAAPMVDWKREVVLVVALGENLNNTLAVKVKGARKNGSQTMVDVECALNAGGSSPAVVVALPRNQAKNVELVPNMTLGDMPMKATYVMSSTGGLSPMATVTTWGALKSDYR